jgi:hypothetical protein
MASNNIPNAPKQLDMNTFKAFSDAQDGLAKSCRFVAVIRPVGSLIAQYNGITRDLMYLTEVAEMPGRGFMSAEVRYYGPNQKFPYQSSYEDISMTFLCRTKSLEREFFDDWQWIINPNNTFDFNYRDEYRSVIDIYQFSDYDKTNRDGSAPKLGGEPTAEYIFTLNDAYPILVSPQPVTWADDQFTRLSVTFTYSWWTRRFREYGPTSSGENASFNLVDRGVSTGFGGTMNPRNRLSYDTN